MSSPVILQLNNLESCHLSESAWKTCSILWACTIVYKLDALLTRAVLLFSCGSLMSTGLACAYMDSPKLGANYSVSYI